MMEFRHLQRFVAVVDHGSINRAAQALAVSQPSLSRSLAQLEHTVGSILFERGPGGIAITVAGEELLLHARMMLSERARALAAMRIIRGERAETIAIGTDAAFAVSRLPQALVKLGRTHPAIGVSVREGGLEELLALVREGQLAVMLGSRAPFLDLDGLRFDQLTMESASVTLRADHRLMAHGVPDLAALVAARWIVPDHPSVIAGWEAMFRRADLPVPEVALRTSSLQLTKACLLEGNYVSMGDHTPYLREIESGQLAWIDLGQPRYERPAGLFRRRDLPLSRAERAFVGALGVPD